MWVNVALHVALSSVYCTLVKHQITCNLNNHLVMYIYIYICVCVCVCVCVFFSGWS
jgi:hypothetical protein